MDFQILRTGKQVAVFFTNTVNGPRDGRYLTVAETQGWFYSGEIESFREKFNGWRIRSKGDCRLRATGAFTNGAIHRDGIGGTGLKRSPDNDRGGIRIFATGSVALQARD